MSTRRRLVVSVVVVGLLVCVATGAWAQGATQRTRASGTSSIGTMAAGMGGAHVAVAAEPTALYWNPAGLARQHGARLYLSAGAATENMDVLEDVWDVADIVSADDTISLGDFLLIRDVVLRNRDRPISVAGGAFAGVGLDNWAIGAYAMGGADGRLAYSAGLESGAHSERVDWSGASIVDGAAAVAYGKVIDARWDIGVTAKMAILAASTADGYARYTVGESNVETFSNSANTEDDTSFTFDVGVIRHGENGQRWALAARNLTRPSFNLGGTTLRVDPSLDIGYAYCPAEGDIVAVDLHNVTEANDGKREFAIGLQKRLAEGWDLRLGYGNDHPTLGLGVNAGFLTVGLAVAPGSRDRLVVSVEAEL